MSGSRARGLNKINISGLRLLSFRHPVICMGCPAYWMCGLVKFMTITKIVFCFRGMGEARRTRELRRTREHCKLIRIFVKCEASRCWPQLLPARKVAGPQLTSPVSGHGHLPTSQGPVRIHRFPKPMDLFCMCLPTRILWFLLMVSAAHIVWHAGQQSMPTVALSS